MITDDGRAGKVKFLNSIDGEIIAGIIFDKPVGDSDGKFKVVIDIEYTLSY